MTETSKLKLYTYWRSSCSYRVRIALNLKGLEHELLPVRLVKNGEQHSDAYKALNPQKLVPTLIHGDVIVRQSIAIMEYLDEAYPETHSLLSADTLARADIRALSLLIATDIQPLDNLRVLLYLEDEMELSDEKKTEWYAHWIIEGFNAYEALLNDKDEFSYGNTPTMADACLIPQVYNAHRFNVDLSAYPNILKVNKNCLELEAFDKARPENQTDAV